MLLHAAGEGKAGVVVEAGEEAGPGAGAGAMAGFQAAVRLAVLPAIQEPDTGDLTLMPDWLLFMGWAGSCKTTSCRRSGIV